MECVSSEDNFISEGEDTNTAFDNLRSRLPFLKKVLDRQDLGIDEVNMQKLQSLYEIIDSKRLSVDEIEICQKVINSLFSKYNKKITKVGDNNMNDSKEFVQSYEEEDKTKSSDVRMEKNKSDQNLNCEQFNQRLKYEQSKQFHSFKEFREAKYGKVKNSKQESTKNKNHDYQQSFKNDELFKKMFNYESKKSCSHMSTVNDPGIIKSFKIPKIKQKDELVKCDKDNSTDINLTTSEIIENSRRTDPIKDNDSEEHMIVTKSINIKTTKDSIDKDMKTCKIQDNNTSRDLKSDTVKDNNKKQIKTSEINKDNNKNYDLKTDADKDDFIETDKDQDLNLEILTESDTVDIKKNDHIIKSELSYKVKKPKKYSYEKKFEKIVKEAVESLNDEYYPRIRTRSSLKKNEESMIKSNIKKAKKVDINDEQLVLKENCKELDKQSGECSENLGSESVQISNSDTSESIEIEQNIISSTSKELLEADYSTKYNISNENIISSSEIYCSVDNTNPKINEKVIFNILPHPELMDILQDKGKLTKLTKLIETSDINTIEENNFNKEHDHSNNVELKKVNKCHKRRRNRNKNDDSLNTEGNVAESSFKDSNDRNLETEYSSVDQVNKKKKRKKSKEKYAHFEIQDKNSCEDLKIVISKFDKNIKKSEHLNLKVSSNDLRTGLQPANDEKNISLKPKKPFLGPLSVKLAIQKMESKMNNTHNELFENTKYKIKTTDNISKINPQSTANMLIEPNVVLHPNECTFSGSNDTFQSELPVAEQNSISTTSAEPNITFVKSKKRRPKMTELDKLHADINQNCAVILTISNVRHCRLNKSIDYTYGDTIVSPKKKKMPSIDLTVDDDDYLETLKKRKIKKLSRTSVKTTISHKRPNILHPENLNKKKLKKSKKNQNKQCNFNKKSSGYNLLNDEVSNEIKLKVASNKEFIDKFYFHSADNLLESTFCHYIDTGLNIVRHYKENHKNEEVFPSRLSKNCAEVLISESLKENFGFLTGEGVEN